MYYNTYVVKYILLASRQAQTLDIHIFCGILFLPSILIVAPDFSENKVSKNIYFNILVWVSLTFGGLEPRAIAKVFGMG